MGEGRRGGRTGTEEEICLSNRGKVRKSKCCGSELMKVVIIIINLVWGFMGELQEVQLSFLSVLSVSHKLSPGLILLPHLFPHHHC